jgi:hypothetical protein
MKPPNVILLTVSKNSKIVKVLLHTYDQTGLANIGLGG